MMRKFCWAALAALAAVSCSEKEADIPQGGVGDELVTFSVSVPEIGTKSVAGSDDDEKAINELEGAISALEAVMSTVEGSTEENFTKYASLKKQLDEAVSRWETNMENLEELS